jgi:hypothetical protein
MLSNRLHWLLSRSVSGLVWHQTPETRPIHPSFFEESRQLFDRTFFNAFDIFLRAVAPCRYRLASQAFARAERAVRKGQP